MSEAQQQTNTQQEPPAAGAGAQPPVHPPVGTPPAPQAQPHKATPPAGANGAAPNGAHGEGTQEAKAPKQLGADDEPEDGADYVLKSSDIKKRVERERRKTLKSFFGTDNEKEIQDRLAKTKELESKAEEQRRAELSEIQRIKEDNEKTKKLHEQSEARVRELEDQREIEAEEKRLTAYGSKHVQPKYVDYAFTQFANHLKTELTEAQQDAITDVQIEEWFTNFAKENPAMAATPAQQQQASTQQQQLPRLPANNGHRQIEKPAPLPSGSLEGKTPVPGLPNSMNAQEYREYKKARGLS